MDEIHVLITLPFPKPLVEKLRAVSTRLKIHMHPARTVEELPPEVLPQAEVLYTLDTLPEPDDVPNLAWIQFHFAGMDHVTDHALLHAGLQVTTLSGAAISQIGEFALMCILALGRRLPLILEDKSKKKWVEDRFKRFRPHDLRGSTVGIVGYGSIGREVARLCRAFGASVLAVKRDLKHLEDLGYVPPGQGDPGAELADRLYPPQALASMAAKCDYLVVTVPLTAKTRGLVNAKVLEKMKPSAFLVDVSRGGVVDHGALVSALEEKQLAGAALDVYPVEPLPESSPLWEMPGVIVSPHIAGASPLYNERAIELFAANLKRYLAGKPLLNAYDPKLGY
ncbi:MAG: D-2-hydroxyacid dehydrogenase [Anaerolineales bacterium]|jgi:phosphoglycerate dehydrogenase-like enzyme